ncbi:MAG: iron complex outermembrane receptor protein [Phenylobacterium sp.]|jgi:iron complex outermembrane receptor protein
MNKFKPSILTLSLLAAGLTFGSIAYAAEDATEKSKTEKDKEKLVETISVKGFRGSVIKSLNTKRYSDTVVDAISADDIGGLPDVSIADSLTRLPGVTSVRIDGQSSELNIRGLSGDFVSSTLNGREQVSPSGGRAVQFDVFPSELIQQAQVYKSQKASLIEGGVAGSVELKTANALTNDEDSVFRFSAHGNWNDVAADNEDSESIGHRLTLSYQQKLLDDTVGISMGYARMFQPTVSSRFVNYQFDPLDLSEAYDGAPSDLLVSSGFELNERGGEDTRDAAAFALNWEPSDDLRFSTDIFYSKFDSQKWDRGLRVSGLNNIQFPNTSTLITNPVLSNGALVGGTFIRDPDGTAVAPPYANSQRSLNVQTQADDNSTDSSLFSWGIKGEWDISDRLFMTVDLAHSEAEEDYKDQVLRLAMFEDSSAETPVIDDNIIISYQLNGLDIPTVTMNQDFTDLNKMMVTSAESYPHIEKNSSDAFRVDFKYELDNDYVNSFETGLRVSNRQYAKSRGRFLYGTTDFNMRNGQYISYSGFDDDGNPIETARFAPFQLTADLATATSIGGDMSGMPAFLAVNNADILNAWIPDVDRTPLRRWDHSWTMSQNNVVEEDVIAAYFQANLDLEVGDMPLTGNIGMRVVQTEQKSTGLLNVGAGNGQTILDDRGIASDAWVLGTEGVKYTDYLPSLNLNLSLTDDDQLRFAYAKVLARPDMDKMANSGNFRWDQRVDGNFIDLDSTTSPTLRPFYADQIDLSFEHYFANGDGAFVVAVWNKDIKNFVGETSEQNFDYAGAGIEVPAVPAEDAVDQNGDVVIWENGTYNRADNTADAGYIRGFELAYNQTFSTLPGAWSGLGVSLNFSYTESEIEIPSTVPGEQGLMSPINGLSPRVYSATLFYDYEELFSTRISARHRAAYLDKQTAIGSDQSAYFTDETILSAQVSYNFTENLQGVLSVDNLTDEANISYFGDTQRTGTIQYFGRTVYFGINYKM